MKKIISSVLLLAACCGCTKFIQVDAPQTQIDAGQVFSNDQTALAATVGLYYQALALTPSFFNGSLTLYNGLSADELTNSNSSTTLDQFKNNELLSSNSTIFGSLWSPAYKNLYQINAVLEGLEQSTSLTPSVKQELQGEMLFMRACHYFYLVNVFGDVPLQLTTDYRTNAVFARTPAATIYNQIITDLLQAKALLTPSFGTIANTRPNKWAAVAMLARVYLYQQRWAEASAQATELIESKTYWLEPDLNNVFLIASGESIFQLMKQTGNTSEGTLFIPSSSTTLPAYTVTSYLLDAFELNDKRKASWLKSNTVRGQVYYYSYKYKTRLATPVTEYYVALRLAEVYLVRAEARAEQNDIPGAQQDINAIRTRAGLNNTTAATTADLLTAIAKERQTELFCEWGHRWRDLKRTKTIDTLFSVRKGPNWQATDSLYPIPLSDMQRNPSLTQNPGY